HGYACLRAGRFAAAFFFDALLVFLGAVFAAARTLGCFAGAVGVFSFTAFAASFTVDSAASVGAAAVFFAAFLAPKRPLPRSGAAASSSRHSSSVSVRGSRSFGIFAFFLRSVMYGP